MCGIVLVHSVATGGLTTKNQKVWEDMMHITSLRGMDSTGVFSVEKTKGETAWIAKEASPSPMFMKGSESWEAIDSYLFQKARTIVGHCRAATRGTVSDETAHPYQHGKIILVHNGTLTSHFSLTTENFAIDSEAICHALSQRPWEEVLPEINGAFVLVWYDLERKVFCIASNGERPLWTAFTKTGDLYAASEYEFILTATARQNEQLFEDEKKHSFFGFPKNSVLEIPFDYTGDIRKLPFQKFEKKAQKSFTRGVVASSTYTGFMGGKTTETTPKKKEKQSRKQHKETSSSNLPDSLWFEVEHIEEGLSDRAPYKIWGRGYHTDNTEYIVCAISRKITGIAVGDWATAHPYVMFTSAQGDYIREENKGLLHYMIRYDSIDLIPFDRNSMNDSVISDVDGVSVSKEEWDELKDQDQRCGCCNSKLVFNELKYATVNKQNGKIHTVICQNCHTTFNVC